MKEKDRAAENADRRLRYRNDREYRERRRAESRKFYAANREKLLPKLRENSRKYYAEHREEVLAAAKETRAADPERFREYQRRWRAKNKARSLRDPFGLEPRPSERRKKLEREAESLRIQLGFCDPEFAPLKHAELLGRLQACETVMRSLERKEDCE